MTHSFWYRNLRRFLVFALAILILTSPQLIYAELNPPPAPPIKAVLSENYFSITVPHGIMAGLNMGKENSLDTTFVLRSMSADGNSYTFLPAEPLPGGICITDPSTSIAKNLFGTAVVTGGATLIPIVGAVLVPVAAFTGLVKTAVDAKRNGNAKQLCIFSYPAVYLSNSSLPGNNNIASANLRAIYRMVYWDPTGNGAILSDTFVETLPGNIPETVQIPSYGSGDLLLDVSDFNAHKDDPAVKANLWAQNNTATAKVPTVIDPGNKDSCGSVTGNSHGMIFWAFCEMANGLIDALIGIVELGGGGTTTSGTATPAPTSTTPVPTTNSTYTGPLAPGA